MRDRRRLRSRAAAQSRHCGQDLSLVSKLFILVGLVLISYGGFVAWPLIYATTHYTEVRGRIIEVFSERLPDDQVRVTIAYDFPVPSRQGRIIAIGHAQWDSSMKRVDG